MTEAGLGQPAALPAAPTTTDAPAGAATSVAVSPGPLSTPPMVAERHEAERLSDLRSDSEPLADGGCHGRSVAPAARAAWT